MVTTVAVARAKKSNVRTHEAKPTARARATGNRDVGTRSVERALPRRPGRKAEDRRDTQADRCLPREVELAIHDAVTPKKRSNIEPVAFEWFAGICIFDGKTWGIAFKKNTRPGFKQLAHVAELCDVHAVQFSVFVEEPRGMLALDVLADVPTASRDGVSQRACVRLDDNKTSVDLVLWLETYIPKLASSAA